jgi:hypothetical protein
MQLNFKKYLTSFYLYKGDYTEITVEGYFPHLSAVCQVKGILEDIYGQGFGRGCYAVAIYPWAGMANLQLKFEAVRVAGNNHYNHFAPDTCKGQLFGI